MNEDIFRKYLNNPAARVGDAALAQIAFLQLDELRAIRKLLEPKQRIEVAEPPPEPPAEPEHPLQAEWDSMMDHQRMHFGTFKAYCAFKAAIEEPDEIPLAIKWVAAEHLTQAQIHNAMGEHDGKYAVQLGDLTDAQRALP